MADKHCTTCWFSVVIENVKTGRKKRNCLKNDGMEVNRRMSCEEWSKGTGGQSPCANEKCGMRNVE